MKIKVSKGKPKDTAIPIPASKSLSHRALISAALADGTSRILHPVDNEDTKATLRCLEALGAVIEKDGEDLIIHGTAGKISYDGRIIDCSESGSTLRFMIPLFGLLDEEVKFTGHGRLMKRPQSVYEELFRERGLLFEQADDILKIKGPLTGGSYTVHGNVSSQFISGLLFAMPLMKEDSTLTVIPPYESRSYVDLTLSALKQAEVDVDVQDMTYAVKGDQTYRPFAGAIEGDASQAAFFIALAMMRNMPLTVANMNHDSLQGDSVMLKLAEQFGAQVTAVPEGWRIIPQEIKAIEADLSDCPDLGPVLFALASKAEGTSCFHGAARLRLKESDRIGAMQEELAKTGCRMEEKDDTVYVYGNPEPKSAVIDGHNDHRIVMAMSVLAASMEEGLIIDGYEAIAKSYPDFFRDLKTAGAETE